MLEILFIGKLTSHSHSSIGGIEILFPLFHLLKDNDWTVEYSMCARILSLINEMMKNNSSNQNDMIEKNSFCTLGFILSELSNKHMNMETLKALQGFIECSPLDRDTFLKHIYSHIFLNFSIWFTCKFEIQKEMLNFLKKQIQLDLNYFKEICNVQYLLDTLNDFYNYDIELDSNLTSQEIYTIRCYFFDILQFMVKDGIKPMEMISILKFILDTSDEHSLMEMLKLLMSFMDLNIPDLVNHLKDESFFIPFSTLLQHEKKVEGYHSNSP
jgi:hypothetical protein